MYFASLSVYQKNILAGSLKEWVNIGPHLPLIPGITYTLSSFLQEDKHKVLSGFSHSVLWVCRLQRRFVWKPVRHIIFAGHVPHPQIKTFGQFLHEMAPQYAASPSRLLVTVTQSCSHDPAPQGILVLFFFSLVMSMFGRTAVPLLSNHVVVSQVHSADAHISLCNGSPMLAGDIIQ